MDQTPTHTHAPNNRQLPMSIEWRDDAIMTCFQNNPHVLRATISGLGLKPPSKMAVYQWISRRRVPERWRPLLIYVLLRERKISVNELFRRGRAKLEPNA